MTEATERVAGSRFLGIGFGLVLAGIAGVWFAWFPAPPHSTGAPQVGWPARWFAAGIGSFGMCLALLGFYLRKDEARRGTGLRMWARRWVALAFCFWAVWLLSIFPW